MEWRWLEERKGEEGKHRGKDTFADEYVDLKRTLLGSKNYSTHEPDVHSISDNIFATCQLETFTTHCPCESSPCNCAYCLRSYAFAARWWRTTYFPSATARAFIF